MTVLDIQRRLAALGFDPGPLDGRAGPRTAAAVEAFQRARKLVADGIVGPNTRAALAGPPETPAPKPAAWRLDARGERALAGVHPDLVKIVRRAAELASVEFTVTEGLRTLARQRKLVAAGASRTMNSRHLAAGPLRIAHAVDLAAKVGGAVRWDWPLYRQLAEAMKRAARDLGLAVEWGGDWKSFRDGPHFQLPFSRYPA